MEVNGDLPVWNQLNQDSCLTWCFPEIILPTVLCSSVSYTACLWYIQLYLEKGIVTYDTAVWKTGKWTCNNFIPICKRVIVEVNYCSLGIAYELKKSFWALGAAYGQGKYKVKGILAYNVLLTVLQSWSYNEAAKFEAITSYLCCSWFDWNHFCSSKCCMCNLGFIYVLSHQKLMPKAEENIKLKMEVEKMTHTLRKLGLHRVNVGICTTQNMQWEHASRLKPVRGAVCFNFWRR